MQCACAILPSVACTALQNFSTLTHKRRDFQQKKVTEHKMRVLISSKSFVWNISHSKKKWVRYDKKCVLVLLWSAAIGLAVKCRYRSFCEVPLSVVLWSAAIGLAVKCRYQSCCEVPLSVLLWSATIGLAVKCRYSFLILMNFLYSNIKFNENPSSRSRVVPWGQAGGRTDMTKLIVVFRNFSNAPNKYEFC